MKKTIILLTASLLLTGCINNKQVDISNNEQANFDNKIDCYSMKKEIENELNVYNNKQVSVKISKRL